MPVQVCVFDAYGTLFDVDGAARIAGEADPSGRLGEVWPRLAADWRRKQLDYTWLRAAAGQHADFWQVTQDALDWALEAAGLQDDELRAQLLALYEELPTYPEVRTELQALESAGLACAILSNGTPHMLQRAVAAAGIAEYFDAVLSVEAVGVFKPARAVYDLVGARFDLPHGEVLFISANGWDICAGAAYGFRTLWVNRQGAPQDRVFQPPEATRPDLTGLAAHARRL